MSDTLEQQIEFVLLDDDLYDYRYPVPRKAQLSFLADDDEKWAILAQGGIKQTSPEQTPLQAWRDAVAVASGLPADHFRPAEGRPLDLGFSPEAVRKFVFYLA